MPLPDIPVPLYPFVPLLPGVPALVRASIDSQAATLLQQAITTGVQPALLTSMLTGAIPSFLNGVTAPLTQLASDLIPDPLADSDIGQEGGAGSGPQWGIFDSDGNQVIEPDNVVSFDWSGAYRTIDYPIEEGNFETYNKVQQPFDPRIVMRKGGSVSDRQDFINTLNTIRGDLKLYSAVTPEISYDSVNITDVSYARRADAGATVIEATISLKQINVTASSAFTNTASPTSQDAFNSGTVDATTPTPTQAAAVPAGGPS